MHFYCTVSKAAGRKCHFQALLMEKEIPKTFVSAAQWKRKLYSGGRTSFCHAQQPYVPMGPRAKRETFQFQSCSCESLITARTGERPWVYIHAAWFRNWAQNKGRETERVHKWPNMTKRNMQKNTVSPPFGEHSDGKENRNITVILHIQHNTQ